MSMGLSWGPSTWYVLHLLSLTWKQELVPLYIRFLTLMSKTIPCIICRRHFNRNIRKTGGIVNNCRDKDRMIKWVIDSHNMVNRKNGKKVYTYEKAKSFYYGNGKLVYKRNLFMTFLREYIVYNFRFSRQRSIGMMRILGQIFPFEGRRERFKKYLVNKNIGSIGIMRWLKGYKKILG